MTEELDIYVKNVTQFLNHADRILNDIPVRALAQSEADAELKQAKTQLDLFKMAEASKGEPYKSVRLNI